MRGLSLLVAVAGFVAFVGCDAGGAEIIATEDQCVEWLDGCGGCTWTCNHIDDVLPNNDCDVACENEADPTGGCSVESEGVCSYGG